MDTIASLQTIAKISYDQVNLLFSVITSPQPNTTEIKQATELIKKYADCIESVEGLLFQIKTNQNSNCRQLSSVILYKCIEKHWNKIPKEKQDLIKDWIITLYSTETAYWVIKGISYIIYKICKQSLLGNEWDKLLEIVFSSPEKYQKEQATLFECNLRIIGDLLKANSEKLKPKLSEIKVLLNTAFQMGSNLMKENATQCWGSILSNYEKTDLLMFKDLSKVVFKEMKNFSEKTIWKCYETLCDFQVNSLYFFEEEFGNIIPLTMELLWNDEYNGNVKLVLSEFLVMIGECKKKIFTQNDNFFLKKFFETAVKLITNPNNEINNDQELYDSTSEFAIGLKMINWITVLISSKRTFPILIELVKHLIKSESALERRGCIAILGEIAEGCEIPVKDNIEDILNLWINAFYNDANENVKGQCILSLDTISQYAAPEINEYYDKIMPMLYKGLFSSNEDILNKSLYEIHYFCNNIDFEMEDYLNMNNEINIQLLSKLINILETSKVMRIQESCLNALGSVVAGAKNVEEGTLIPVVDSLKQITINKNTVNDQTLIRSTLHCVSSMMLVIKYEKFAIFEEYFSKFAFECVKSTVYELQFGGLSYFASLADIKKAKFADILDGIIPYVYSVMKDNSGVIEKTKEKDEFAFDSDSEDEMEGNGDMVWNSDFMDAKCMAIKALRSFALAVPGEFIKYFKDSLAILDQFTDYCNDDVIFEVIDTYQALLFALDDAEKVINSASTNVNDKSIGIDISNFWVTEVFSRYEEIINNTDTQELLIESMQSIYSCINRFGKSLFLNNNTLERIMLLNKKLWNNEMMCQIKNEDVEEEDVDHEGEMFDAVEGIFLILAEKLRDEFHTPFTEVFPFLQKYLKISRPVEDRSMAFGVIAEVLKHTNISTKFYIELLFKEIDNNLKAKKTAKKNEDLLRHISYLIGIFFFSDVTASVPYLERSLVHLQFIFENSKRAGKDNVIAALCRIITSMKLNPSNFPLFDKSVDTIMLNLPLKYDPSENLTVVKFLIYVSGIFNIEHYTKYIDGLMKVLQICIVNDAKCETKKEDVLEIKGYIELLNKNETIKNMIEGYILGKFTQNEKDKFVNMIANA